MADDKWRDLCRQLPKPDPHFCTPQWIEREQQMRDALLNGGSMHRFLQWKSCQLSLVKPNADLELAYLRLRPDWQTQWEPAIQESTVGNVPRCASYRQSSGLLLRHAALVAWYEEVTGKSIVDFDHIFEFGGGHGCMCRLIHRLGFRGRYLIYDLPMLALLQRFYLENNGIQGTFHTWDFEVLKNVEPAQQNTLFIATWSLSEAPYSIRDEVFNVVSDCDGFLIASQFKIRELDNLMYFRTWVEKLPDMTWHRKTVRKVLWLAGVRR